MFSASRTIMRPYISAHRRGRQQSVALSCEHVRCVYDEFWGVSGGGAGNAVKMEVALSRLSTKSCGTYILKRCQNSVINI